MFRSIPIWAKPGDEHLLLFSELRFEDKIHNNAQSIINRKIKDATFYTLLSEAVCLKISKPTPPSLFPKLRNSLLLSLTCFCLFKIFTFVLNLNMQIVPTKRMNNYLPLWQCFKNLGSLFFLDNFFSFFSL